jgi:hypothetical protein
MAVYRNHKANPNCYCYFSTECYTVPLEELKLHLLGTKLEVPIGLNTKSYSNIVLTLLGGKM